MIYRELETIGEDIILDKGEDDDRRSIANGSRGVLLPRLAHGLDHIKTAGILSDKLESYLSLGHCMGRTG